MRLHDELHELKCHVLGSTESTVDGLDKDTVLALIECTKTLIWYANTYNYGYAENNGGEILNDEGGRAGEALRGLSVLL